MSTTEEDLTDLRTRLLKRHAEEAMKEIVAIDPTFKDCTVIFLMESNEIDDGAEETRHRLTMVANVSPVSMALTFMRATEPRTVSTRKQFARGH